MSRTEKGLEQGNKEHQACLKHKGNGNLTLQVQLLPSAEHRGAKGHLPKSPVPQETSTEELLLV